MPETGPASDVSFTVSAVAVVGSMGMEKVTTTGSESAMFSAPLAGLIDVTVGGRAMSAKSSGTTWRGVVAVAVPAPLSFVSGSRAMSVAPPSATGAM